MIHQHRFALNISDKSATQTGATCRNQQNGFACDNQASPLIADILKTPELIGIICGRLQRRFMLNTVVNYFRQLFIAKWRHLAKDNNSFSLLKTASGHPWHDRRFNRSFTVFRPVCLAFIHLSVRIWHCAQRCSNYNMSSTTIKDIVNIYWTTPTCTGKASVVRQPKHDPCDYFAH